MTPPCYTFPASQLPLKIQFSLDGKKRKTERGRPIDLSACELLELVQYNCRVDNPHVPNSPVRCYPVERFFRRCRDKKGTFMVETTAWEGTAPAIATNAATKGSPASSAPHKSSLTAYWHDGDETDYYSSR